MAKRNARGWADLYMKEVLRRYNSEFEIKYKKDSKLFKIFKPVILLINPNFFISYITVLFGVLWVPDDFFGSKSPLDVLETLAHEGVHEYDRKKLLKIPFLFEAIWTFPQCLLIPFTLVALFTWCGWWMIPALVCLGPLPAPGRYWLEMRAYRISKIWGKHFYGFDEDWRDEDIVRQMSELRTYWGCWPFKKWVRKDLAKSIDESEAPYEHAIYFLKKHKLKRQVRR